MPSHYDSIKGDITAIRNGLDNTIRNIRSNPNYSDTGRRREMAKATVAARREADQLKAQFTTKRAAERTRLERQLFGVNSNDPSAVILMRDSQDRAAKLDSSDDATAMLNRAQQTGDTYLARAVAQRASTQGWNDIVNTYADTTGTRDLFDALADNPDGPNTRTADAMVFQIPAPTELRGMADHDLQHIADTYTEQEQHDSKHRAHMNSGSLGTTFFPS